MPTDDPDLESRQPKAPDLHQIVEARVMQWLRLAMHPSGASVVALISLGISVGSLLVSGWLGLRQVELGVKQVDLMLKQDEILDRRAILSVEIGGAGVNTNEQTMVVRNDGRKTARDFYCVIRADASRLRGYGGGVTGTAECDRVNDRQMVITSGLYIAPLYPSRTSESIGLFAFWNTEGTPVEIEWQVTSEDGVFPVESNATRNYPEGIFGVVKMEAGGETKPKDFQGMCAGQ